MVNHILKKKSRNICGLFSDYVKNYGKSKIYNDPNVSIAAVGKLRRYFTEKPKLNSYGRDSFFDRFCKSDGKICNINLDSGSTFIHYFERKNKVNYRFDKKFYGVKDKKKTISILNVRKLKKKYEPNFVKFHETAIKKRLYKKFYIGKAYVGRIKIKDVENIISENLKRDKKFLIKG